MINSTEGPVCLDGILLSSPDQEEVTVPKTVRMIAGGAFHGKKKLKRVVIPSSVKTIGQNAFSACRNLEAIRLSKGLTQIERNAFRRCSALTAIRIPDTVESIGDYAFLGCYHLNLVEFEGSGLEFGKAVFAKPWREIWRAELSREEQANPPRIEAVANCMPASILIKIFGIGAVLGFCRAALNGVHFRDDDRKAYEKYLRRNRDKILAAPEQNEPAITYMQGTGLL